jgi:hypothetical protein
MIMGVPIVTCLKVFEVGGEVPGSLPSSDHAVAGAGDDQGDLNPKPGLPELVEGSPSLPLARSEKGVGFDKLSQAG